MAVTEVAGRGRNAGAIKKTVAALTAAFGNSVVTSQAVREQHGNTVTWIANQPPDAVVFPQSTEEVQQIVRICAESGVAVIPYGVGTSLEGHVNAPAGGVSIDFRDMNKVLAVHAEDLDCVIEPGITRKALNEQLRDSGLFFPIDPGADASLGGMAATRCSGTNAVRYGTMKDDVLALKVVLANGEVIDTARRAKKTSAGYDLTRLMVGSEGTLGIITAIDVEAVRHSGSDLRRICPSIRGSVLEYRNSHDSVRHSGGADRTARCAAGARRSTCIPSSGWRRRRRCSLNSTAPRRRSPSSRSAWEIAADFGGGPSTWTTRPEERTRIVGGAPPRGTVELCAAAGRQIVRPMFACRFRGWRNALPKRNATLRKAASLRRSSATSATVIFIFTLLVDMEDADEVRRAKALSERLVERALAMDGTCTGEHGVGQGKMKYLVAGARRGCAGGHGLDQARTRSAEHNEPG